jgi:hypothetical protein
MDPVILDGSIIYLGLMNCFLISREDMRAAQREDDYCNEMTGSSIAVGNSVVRQTRCVALR